MAKLKNNGLPGKSPKLPALGADSVALGSISRTAVPKDAAARILSPITKGSVLQSLSFGTMHTKSGSTSSSSGSQWTGLLNAASGGVSGVIGGGFLSGTGLGFIGKLFSLFGGGKTLPAAPVQFQSPVSQQESLAITGPGHGSSVSLGVHPAGNSGAGVYQHIGSTVLDHSVHSAQVVQIVKQALLTSSSLNDVISEI